MQINPIDLMKKIYLIQSIKLLALIMGRTKEMPKLHRKATNRLPIKIKQVSDQQESYEFKIQTTMAQWKEHIFRLFFHLRTIVIFIYFYSICKYCEA